MGVIKGEGQQFRCNQTLGDAGGGIQTIERQLSFCAQSKWGMCRVQNFYFEASNDFFCCVLNRNHKLVCFVNMPRCPS